MGKIELDGRVINIVDIVFYSYYSSVYLKPKFFISFEITDQIGEGAFKIAFDFRHIEMDGYQNAEELFGTEIQLNELQLNKTLNVEYLDGLEIRLISLTFLLYSSSEERLISGKGTILNSSSKKTIDFRFNSSLCLKETNNISITTNSSNVGYSRMELIRSIGDIYNSKGMLGRKSAFPNTHRGYEIINEWLRTFGTVSQLYQDDYSIKDFRDIKGLNDLIVNFIAKFDENDFFLPEIPELYATKGWSEIKEKARTTLSSITLKRVHPSFKMVLTINEEVNKT